MAARSGRLEGVDVDGFKSKMHSLAYGNAMMAAARDYQAEMLAAQQAGPAQSRDINMDDFLNDPDLEKLHEERMAQMKREVEKRQAMQRKGHGEYQEVEEGDFLEVVTQTPRAVAHFYHRDFMRCKIVDKHMDLLRRKYFETRFIKISAPDAPFFTEKLQVRMLPCVIMFVAGVAVDRIVGFEELGAKDDYPTAAVERRLLKCGAVVASEKRPDDSDDEEGEQLRRVVHAGNVVKSYSDEDSDFD